MTSKETVAVLHDLIDAYVVLREDQILKVSLPELLRAKHDLAVMSFFADADLYISDPAHARVLEALQGAARTNCMKGTAAINRILIPERVALFQDEARKYAAAVWAAYQELTSVLRDTCELVHPDLMRHCNEWGG
jgi:hypothetical protein